MLSSHRVYCVSIGIGAAIVFIVGASCSHDNPAEPTVTGILLARGGVVPKVEATDPPGAPQYTKLDVRVFGSGFDEGSKATLLLDGLEHPKVTTDTTRFVSRDELVATITITDADLALYDVQVITSRGKKGIGVDLFMVVLAGEKVEDLPVSATFSDRDGDAVLSDKGGPYQGDNVFIRDNGNLFFDVRSDIPRQFCFDFDDPQYNPPTSCDDGYMTTKDADVAGAMRVMPPLSTMTTRALVYWSVPVEGKRNTTSPRFLRYGVHCDLSDASENKLLVTRTGPNTWILEGDNAILCVGSTTGRPTDTEVGVFSMPFKLTLETIEP